jgi:hypothetical protein
MNSLSRFTLAILVIGVSLAASSGASQAAPNWSAMTISTGGFGDLKLGQTPEEVQQVIGESLRKVSSAADASCYFTPASEERLVLRFKAGKLVSIDSSSNKVGVTRSGLRVGDTADKARGIYNKDASFKESKSPFDGRPVMAVGGGANQVAFAASEGKVDLIRLGLASDFWGRCE